MTVEEKKEQALRMIDKQYKKLEELTSMAYNLTKANDVELLMMKLENWKAATTDIIAFYISKQRSVRLKEITLWGSPSSMLEDISSHIQLYQEFLTDLEKEIEKDAELFFATNATRETIEDTNSVEKRIPLSNAVFIVHGHDEVNLLKLWKLLKEQFHLNPIILKDQPGRSRTLIEKLEQEGSEVGYAFVLYTPDDIVELANGKYAQARPNVIFELGWFFGRLGRSKVCIIFKKGTKIHSDLKGINRIEFSESVEEKVIDIEKELKAAGLLELGGHNEST